MMRIPLARLRGDKRPIERWEWFFAPVVCPLFLLVLGVLALLSIPYFWLYPERHAHVIDVEGTDEQKRTVAARREYRQHIGVGRRLLERLHVVPFDSPPHETGP